MTAGRPFIGVVDLGVGNLRSLMNALDAIGADARPITGPDEVREAVSLVLPGVGAFRAGMDALASRGLAEPIVEDVHAGKPILGICLGLQLFMTEGEEFGRHRGLDLVPGRVVALPEPDAAGEGYKVPHIGWSPIQPVVREDRSPLDEIPPGSYVYYAHSYVVEPARSEHVLATTRHGPARFPAVLRAGNVLGCQFHPEKSGPVGLAILKACLKSPLGDPVRG